ncbi:MAG TPA: DUF1800 domain-containing protein [Candidatus Eremiobacteraceae bacterium]|jgi:uncharacterized protein (DUF1800 family)
MIDQPQNDQFRPRGSVDASSALLPYRGPWSPRLAAHLLRRAGFGGSPAEIGAAASAGMNAAVDGLLDPRPDTLPSSPQGDLTYLPMAPPEQRRDAYLRAVSWWLDRMLQTPNPLIERMTYFWHNHFTSGVQGGITPAMMVVQNRLFRANALGNYAYLTHQVARDPAMLLYLNGNQNRSQHPNENFARELMELFSMGVGNYTEQDVRESARAFTGWIVPRDGASSSFVARFHDAGSKTFLGHTGAFAGDDVIDVIMGQPATAQFMARKFLRNFVYDDPEQELVDATAGRFADAKYDVAALLDTLLRSNVFYSDRAYRSIVKSPVDLVVGALRTIGVTTSTPRVIGAMNGMDQVLMRPPNVAGWPGGSQWLNQGTILARLNFLNQLVSFRAASPVTQMQAMPAMAGPLAWIAGVSQTDASAVAARVLDLTVQSDVTDEQRQSIVGFLTTDGVGNPVELNGENIDEKVRGAMSLAMALPAYQLE